MPHETEITIARPAFLGGNEWSLKRLNRINVVLGKNGCGKSQLLRTLRDKAPASCHYIVPERTGEISFAPNLMAEVNDPNKRRRRSNGNFLADYRSEVVTRIQGYYTKRGTKKAAEINHDPDELMKSLELILPDFTIRVKSSTPFYELTRIKDGVEVTSVSNLSSGESQLLSIGMDILTMVGMWELDDEQNRVLLIDEPDAHIHPDLQVKFADFISHIEAEYDVQIFVATHSTTLLSALGQFGSEKVSVFYVGSDKSELVGEPLNSVTKELSAILGGHLVMGPLFAAPVLLVEGDDDYRVWVQVVRGGSVKVSVLPCNGEEIRRYQKTLERMFNALSENMELRGIALIDADKPLPEANEHNPQQYVKFIQLACHETENLYLTDEVLLEMGHTWESAVNAVLAKADLFGEKADQLKKLAELDRKNCDVKGIIHQLAEILDPKRLLWSLRLGKAIGKGRPTGMLESFIGNELVSHLWQQSPEDVTAI